MMKVLVVVWLRRSAANLTPRLPGFDLRSAHVGYMVDIVSLGQSFLRIHLFPLSFPSHPHLLLIKSSITDAA
jgi:hypothetical protein